MTLDRCVPMHHPIPSAPSDFQDTHMVTHNPTASNTFANLSVGINPYVWDKLAADYLLTASPDEALAFHDAGYAHFSACAARNGGRLDLVTEQSSTNLRTNTKSPFPLQSIPKTLRPAIIPPDEGHVLIDLDYRACHWQLLAFTAKDENLIADLRAGNFYANILPGADPKACKVSLNIFLNGGGLAVMAEQFGNETDAEAFLEAAKDMLATRWEKAGKLISTLRTLAKDKGWVTEEYKGGGVACMRLESKALRRAAAHPDLAALGMRVLLPMQDGILVSAPADKADEVARKMAMAMVHASTKSEDEATNHTDTWVKAVVSSSWGGAEENTSGRVIRARALAGVSQVGDPVALKVAACVHPVAFANALKSTHGASADGKAYRAALAKADAASAWLRVTTAHKAEHPPVTLPHPEPSYANLRMILLEDKALPKLAYNVRENVQYLGGKPITDVSIAETYLPFLEHRYGMLFVGQDTLLSVIAACAMANQFDPVKDYLDELLPWDGTPRLENWLTKYASAEDTPLHREYAAKWMVSVARRAFEPGYKVDSMLILTGAQGRRKSTLLATIAPAGSFADVKIDPHNKDSVLQASKYAIVEWGEMAQASKRDQETLKSYLTLREDEVRPPYARLPIRIPRRTVFSGSTNGENHLVDDTGHRRFWTVPVGAIDIEGLAAVKDLLWAEAVHYALDDTYTIYLDDAAITAKAAADIRFQPEDPHASKLEDFVASKRGHMFSIGDVMDYMDIRPTERDRMTKVYSKTLRAIGCETRTPKEHGKTVRRWVREGDTWDDLSGVTIIPGSSIQDLLN